MFVERLETLAERIGPVLAISLVAKDGIPVESVRFRGGAGLDLDLLAAELMSQVRAVSQNHRELAVGRVRHFSVSTDLMTLMVSGLTEEYSLLLVLEPGANVGHARFELRRAILLFENDL